MIAVPSDEAVTQALQLVRGGGQVLLFAHTKQRSPKSKVQSLKSNLSTFNFRPSASMKKTSSAATHPISRCKRGSAACVLPPARCAAIDHAHISAGANRRRSCPGRPADRRFAEDFGSRGCLIFIRKPPARSPASNPPPPNRACGSAIPPASRRRWPRPESSRL